MAYDFRGARRIVNGTDKQDQYAAMCTKWLSRIPQLMLDPSKPESVKKETLGPAGLVPNTDTAKGADIAKTAIEGKTLIPKGAIEIAIEFTFRNLKITSLFWYVSHRLSSGRPPKTIITGKGVRFLISVNTDTNRQTYPNISLRQLVERIGTKYGVDTIIPSEPAVESVKSKVSQNGESDYAMLVRMAKASGFNVEETKDSPPKLKLIKPKDAPKARVAIEWGCTFVSSDEASAERVIKTLPKIDALIDGKTIGEGYATQLSVSSINEQILSLLPGTIIDIPKGAIIGLPDNSAFNREYVLKAINKAWTGSPKVTLDLVIPVNVEEKKKASAESTNGTSSSVTNVSNISVAWTDSSSKISKYFTVLDVTKGEVGRIPETDQKKTNAKVLAFHLDALLEKWAAFVKVDAKPGLFGVTSWYRSPSINASVGGAVGSMHIQGSAADIYNTDSKKSLTEFQSWVDQNWDMALGYGAQKGFCHLDTRQGRIRWDY